jgi:glutamate mutase epsilon subunit
MYQVRIVIHPWMGGFSEQSETAFSIAFKAEGRMLRGQFTKTQKKARRVVRQAGFLKVVVKSGSHCLNRCIQAGHAT